jgi:uncharacterized lipoprotein YajG
MKTFAIVLCLTLVSGCATTDATLDVGHDPESVQSGPLSEVGSIAVVPGVLEDLRPDRERIGFKKNGFGSNMADITSEEPVTDIVMNAVVHAFESNGHAVGKQGLTITGSVNQFWVDIDQNFWSIEVIGNVEAALVFADSVSGDTVYQRVYKGSYSEKRQMVTNTAYTDAISGAVSSLINEIVFDEDLAEALTR